MITTVSISDFRRNLSKYLTKAKDGKDIVLKDEKKGEIIAKITIDKQFDRTSFMQTLHKTAGIFTAEKHPEWKTKKDVMSWVRKSRQEADRIFE